MFIKMLLISIVLVAIVMLALGVKLLFDKNAKFTVHSCNPENNDPEHEGSCSKCGLESPSVYDADTANK
jgi:hypothetical protein